MERKSYKERERARRESEILHMAGQLIRRDGYAQFNMEGLADAVGISKPTLYQHFSSKEELVAQAVIRGTYEMVDFVESQHQGSALDKLEALLRFMMASLHNPEAFPTMLLGTEVKFSMFTHPALIEPLHKMQATLYRWVEEGKAAGEINPALPTLVVVGAVFALTEVSEPAHYHPVGEMPREQLFGAIVQLYRRGVGV